MRTAESTNATVFELASGSAATNAPVVATDRLEASRTKRQARHARGVTELFHSRDELRGIYAPADLVEEFTRWTA